MPDLKEGKPIELRSDEIDEILGKSPNWFLRRGVLLLFCIILLFFTGSWLFKYPDIIISPVIITSDNPPSPVVARNSGKLADCYVKDKQEVKAGQYLAVLENSSDINSIFKLRTNIACADSTGVKFYENNITSSSIPNLGDLQQPYLNWVNAIINYQRYIELGFNTRKIQSLLEQIALTNNYIDKLKGQSTLQEYNLMLAQRQYNRDSTLYRKNVTTTSEFEKAEVGLIGTKSAYKNSEITLSGARIQAAQLEQQVIELRLTDENETRRLVNEINSAFRTLRSQFIAWELAYVLKSKIDGVVSMGKYWSTNQNVKAGDQVMTVLPAKPEKPVGKLILPMLNAGKVKPGQSVNIKLTNFPYVEYGMLKGKVLTISSVPEEGNYYVEVLLENGLVTTYNKQLPFAREMTGSAEIITENLRLIERLVSPIYALFKEKI